MLNLTREQQKLSSSCVSACIAIVTGMPQEKVIEEFHDRYRDDETDLGEYLNAYMVPHLLCGSLQRELEANHTYILCVPSLTRQTHHHAIVVTLGDEGGPLVFDPNEGRKYQPEEDGPIVPCPYYVTKWEDDDGASIQEHQRYLGGWVLDADFENTSLEAWRKDYAVGVVAGDVK